MPCDDVVFLLMIGLVLFYFNDHQTVITTIHAFCLEQLSNEINYYPKIVQYGTIMRFLITIGVVWIGQKN